MPGGQDQPLLNPNIHNLPNSDLWARYACDNCSYMAFYRWACCSNPSNWSAADLKPQDYYAKTWCPDTYDDYGDSLPDVKNYFNCYTKIDCAFCWCLAWPDLVIRASGGAACYLLGSIKDACNKNAPSSAQSIPASTTTKPSPIIASREDSSSAAPVTVPATPAIATTAAAQSANKPLTAQP